jgi:signal transduction histidine kinase
MNLILAPSRAFLGISYQTLAILSLCVLLLLLVFVRAIQVPIRKITKELDEDQRQFLANVSHDFRSPLTSIKGYIEAFLDGTIPPELQEKYFKIILTETERLNKLTQSILELNKYGSDHRTMLDLEPFDINNVIKMILQVFEGICIRRKISFELILTGQSLFVLADVSKIQQIIYNLIDNAIKFSPDNSVITVETTEAHGKAQISIKDQGEGIPKSSLKKIWTRFYKIDPSRGRDKRGTGLGLAIAREIIQAHNETISVNSVEGLGSEFVFTLPLGK